MAERKCRQARTRAHHLAAALDANCADVVNLGTRGEPNGHA